MHAVTLVPPSVFVFLSYAGIVVAAIAVVVGAWLLASPAARSLHLRENVVIAVGAGSALVMLVLAACGWVP